MRERFRGAFHTGRRGGGAPPIGMGGTSTRIRAICRHPWSRRRARIIVQVEDGDRKMWGKKSKNFYKCVLKKMMQAPKAVTCRIAELVQAETCA